MDAYTWTLSSLIGNDSLSSHSLIQIPTSYPDLTIARALQRTQIILDVVVADFRGYQDHQIGFSSRPTNSTSLMPIRMRLRLRMRPRRHHSYPQSRRRRLCRRLIRHLLLRHCQDRHQCHRLLRRRHLHTRRPFHPLCRRRLFQVLHHLPFQRRPLYHRCRRRPHSCLQVRHIHLRIHHLHIHLRWHHHRHWSRLPMRLRLNQFARIRLDGF